MEKKLRFGINAGIITCIVLGILGVLSLVFGIYTLSLARTDDTIGIFLTFSLFGGLLLLCVVISLINEWRRQKKMRRLLKSNVLLWGQITDLIHDRNAFIKKVHPYYVLVRVRWHNGTVRTLRSMPILVPLDESILGKQVPVYAHETDLRIYFIDLDEIFSKTEKN